MMRAMILSLSRPWQLLVQKRPLSVGIGVDGGCRCWIPGFGCVMEYVLTIDSRNVVVYPEEKLIFTTQKNLIQQLDFQHV